MRFIFVNGIFVLNLPVEVIWDITKKIEYLYSATGEKLRKKVTDGSKIVTIEYLDGFQYKHHLLEFFPHAEGYVNATPSSLNPSNPQYAFNYVYNYTDHLGNIRISYTKDPQTGNLKILDESHYYPFGLKHQEYQVKGFIKSEEEVIVAPLAHNPYQYKYQGQELQDELGLNWYSFKWRNYMPDIGRFFNVDPLSEDYAYQGHYNFSENRVVDAIELEGLECISIHDINANNRTASVTIRKTILISNSGDGALTNDKITSRGVSRNFERGNTKLYVSDLPNNGESLEYISKKNWKGGSGYAIDVKYDVNVEKVDFETANILRQADPELYSSFKMSGSEEFEENVIATSSISDPRNTGQFNEDYFGIGGKEMNLSQDEVVTHEVGSHNMKGARHKKDKHGNSVFPTKGLESNVPGMIYPTKDDTKRILEKNKDRIYYE